MDQVRIKCLEIAEEHVQGRDMLKIRSARVYKKSSRRYQRIVQGFLHQD
jgi:hypothetical protein